MTERLVHPPPSPSPWLAPVSFLVGEFSGEGMFGPDRFRKRSRGAWAAGSRHVVLEMEADYLLDDGRIDRHAALVVVSASKGRLESRAYTDGGAVLDYPIGVEGDALVFEDRVPHGVDARSARKILRPVTGGYEETLEVETGPGRFDSWARITLLAPEG